MIRATILIRTEVPSRGETPSTMRKILGQARKVPGVMDAFVMYGRFDFVVQIKGNSFEEIIKTAAIINSIPQIQSTETLIEASTTVLTEALRAQKILDL